MAYYPTIIFLLWRLIILLYQIFLQPHFLLTEKSVSLYQRIYLSWLIYWDSGHYLSIASNGYQFPQQAFFPLWPLLVKIGTLILPIYPVTYFLIFVTGLITFNLFYLLVKKITNIKNARLALIVLAAFPSTFFLHAAYTENLFLSMALLSFLMLENKRYLLSGFAGGLAGLTRSTGPALALSFLFSKIPNSKKALCLTLAFTGLLIYMTYLKIAFNDPLYFVKGQLAWCEVQGRCGFVFPFEPMYKIGRFVFLGLLKPGLSFVFIDWFSTIIFLLMSVYVFLKLRLNYAIYTLLAILLPLSSGTTVGMIRFILIAFPVFIVIPLLIRARFLFWLLIILMFLLQLRLITLFTNNLWVA